MEWLAALLAQAFRERLKKQRFGSLCRRDLVGRETIGNRHNKDDR